MYIDSPAFTVVGTGGDLGPGHSAYWDITVSLTDAFCSATFNYAYRDTSDEDHTLAVYMGGTLRRSPFDAPDVVMQEAGPGTTTLRRIPVVKTSGVAQTVTGFVSTDAAFRMQLHGGFALVTGDVSAGKSAVLRLLAEREDPSPSSRLARS